MLYGAAEFSRDTDVALLADSENLDRLRSALNDLDASVIGVPPFDIGYLLRGHAIHFRCMHPEARGNRLDVMAVMRGVAPFAELWSRRTTLELATGDRYEVASLPDLVQMKKTQRDKDWPMIRRLVEANMAQYAAEPTPERVRFWLGECRSAEELIRLASAHSALTSRLVSTRPLLTYAVAGDAPQIEAGLRDEEDLERARDRTYWAPLREELSALMHGSRMRRHSHDDDGRATES